jgi:hypothetical protein
LWGLSCANCVKRRRGWYDWLRNLLAPSRMD